MMRWIFAALLLFGVHKVSTASPWIYADDDEVPEDAIRITSLGSGTPDVHKEQVRVQCQHISHIRQDQLFSLLQ